MWPPPIHSTLPLPFIPHLLRRDSPPQILPQKKSLETRQRAPPSTQPVRH
ncbi:predicted protein [Arabidopsis lyrata subsp. lyrata]|uniref:Predicted protein n=1 Tax=Arabidopsis lyrata subsp. lyrata TaxID=81972 RepID=D7LPN7_ARALL|nr:predicted protein [Arabidopsis lyrata subsp. lyrata]